MIPSLRKVFVFAAVFAVATAVLVPAAAAAQEPRGRGGRTSPPSSP